MNADKPMVVKIGGSTLGSHDTTLEDLVALQENGIVPVVVHGGGSLITEWLKKLAVATRFEKGQRVTDKASLEVVAAVLAGLVNKELVADINVLGGKAIGLSGVDAGLIQGRTKSPELGYVGEVIGVNLDPLQTLLEAGYMPVVAPLGFNFEATSSDEALLLNINADSSAAALAAALGADKLVFLTDVPGVCDKAGKLIPDLTCAEAKTLIASGVISGGMIPKAEACLRALDKVRSTHIVDGRVPGALRAVAEGRVVGTRIRA